MNPTVRDILPFVQEQASPGGGSCEDEKVLETLNAALRLLWKRGDWPGTVERGRACPTECCYRLPYRWETIRSSWFGTDWRPARGAMYEAMPNIGWRSCCQTCCDSQFVKTSAKTPFSDDPKWSEFYLMVEFPEFLYPDPPEDWEATGNEPEWSEDENILPALVVNGLDSRGFQRRQVWVASKEGPPVADKRVLWSEVTSVTRRGKTLPIAVVYATAVYHNFNHGYFDSLEDAPQFLAAYDNGQKYCGYSVYKLIGGSGDCPIYVDVKLRFQPLTSLDDELPIPDENALIFAMKAINARSGEDSKKYAENLQLAEESLNECLEDERQIEGEDVFLDVSLAGHGNNLTPFGGGGTSAPNSGSGVFGAGAGNYGRNFYLWGTGRGADRSSYPSAQGNIN
jgi:hypothetical protein